MTVNNFYLPFNAVELKWSSLLLIIIQQSIPDFYLIYFKTNLGICIIFHSNKFAEIKRNEEPGWENEKCWK